MSTIKAEYEKDTQTSLSSARNTPDNLEALRALGTEIASTNSEVILDDLFPELKDPETGDWLAPVQPPHSGTADRPSKGKKPTRGRARIESDPEDEEDILHAAPYDSDADTTIVDLVTPSLAGDALRSKGEKRTAKTRDPPYAAADKRSRI